MDSDELIFQTNLWQIELGWKQSYLGRSVIILKRDVLHLSELAEEEFADIFKITKKLEKSCGLAFGATMFNSMCLMNSNWKTEIPRKFMHWHFVPRYKYPITFENTNFIDTEFGAKFHWEKVFGTQQEKQNQTKDYSPEFRQKIIKEIQKYL